jgi:hypothetical protein
MNKMPVLPSRWDRTAAGLNQLWSAGAGGTALNQGGPFPKIMLATNTPL